MERGNCTKIILDFGPGPNPIDNFRKGMFWAVAETMIKDYPSIEFTTKELAEKAYEMCEFEDFDTKDGFYEIQKYDKDGNEVN